MPRRAVFRLRQDCLYLCVLGDLESREIARLQGRPSPVGPQPLPRVRPAYARARPGRHVLAGAPLVLSHRLPGWITSGVLPADPAHTGSGNACLRYEEQLGEALQILRVLRLLPLFRDGERGPVAQVVATWQHEPACQATQHRACSKSSDAHAETPIPGVLPGGASDVPDTHASDPAGTAAHGRVALDARQQPHARGGGGWAAAPVVRGRAP